MQRFYAILKCIVAFFSVMTGVLLVGSVINLLFFTNNFSQLRGMAERLLSIVVLILLLWLAYILCRFGYRLFMRVRSSGDLTRKIPLSPGTRKVLAIVYLVVGSILMLSFIGSLGKGFSEDKSNNITTWMTTVLIGVSAFFLIKKGYPMLKPEKATVAPQIEKI